MLSCASPGAPPSSESEILSGEVGCEIAGDVPHAALRGPPVGAEILGVTHGPGECQSLWGVLLQACGVQECEHRLPGALLVHPEALGGERRERGRGG